MNMAQFDIYRKFKDSITFLQNSYRYFTTFLSKSYRFDNINKIVRHVLQSNLMELKEVFENYIEF